jgi:C4-dicarboxylate-specific signal transduction histidine kinase
MSVARNTAAKGIGRELPVEGAAEVQRFANAGRLAASVSQDLLSALGVAQTDVGFLCDLLEQRERQRDMRETVEDARAAISRAVSRISAVLSVARPRRGEVVALDVREVIGAALFDLDARLAAYTVVRDLHPSPFATAERGSLLQSIVSLLLDAADATPQRGRIGITLRGQGELVTLSIDDEGPSPISPDTLAERPNSPLWICRNVVRSFGGELIAGLGPLGGRRVTLQLQADRLSE